MRACPRCLSVYVTDVEFCGIDGARLEETHEDPLLGKVIDRYTVEALIGRGAMGSVYRVRHEVLDREFALKVLLGDFATDRTLVARFRREAQALSRVRHHNVVSVIDFGNTEAGLTYLVMDYVAGPSLASVLDVGLSLEPKRAAKLARQVALGLAEAHALGLVHRDVKPSNILLTEEGGVETVRLVDFGIVAMDGAEESTKLTGVGKVVGTPSYMAPEQARGVAATAAVDLYALGVIFYQMLSGQVPFQGKGIADVLIRHATEAPPPLMTRTGLEPMVYALLAKDPANRPASAAQVALELQRWLVEAGPGEPEVAHPRTRRSFPPSAADQSAEVALGTMEIDEALGWARWGFWRRRVVLLAAVLGLGFIVHRAIREPESGEAPASFAMAETPDASAPDAEARQDAAEAAVGEAPTDAGGQDDLDAEISDAGEADAAAPEDETPSESSNALSRLERRIQQAIHRRGLTESDLDYFASTLALERRFARAQEENRETDAVLHAAELLDAVHTLPLGRSFLRWKIDRLASRIRHSSLEASQKKALEQRRLELRREIPARPEPQAAEALALKITRFERELERKLR